MRATSAGGIWHPHCGQGVASDAITFPRLIFFRGGHSGILSLSEGVGLRKLDGIEKVLDFPQIIPHTTGFGCYLWFL
jgi:hypothetical protein